MPVTLKSNTQRGGVPTPDAIEVPSYLAGHFLWEAMNDWREQYDKMTRAAHDLADHEDKGDDGRVQLDVFVRTALEQAEGMVQSLRRAFLFTDGENYDTFINRDQLGPDNRPKPTEAA